VTGDLGGSGRGDPSICMGRLVVFRSLLRRRHRSLFLVPSAEDESREKRGLSAFSTFLAKQDGDFYTIREAHGRLMLHALYKGGG